MIEEIVTKAAPKVTQKTKDDQALTLKIGEEAAIYVEDARTKQKLIDLVTAKVSSSSNARTTSEPNVNATSIGVVVFFIVILIFGIGYLYTGNSPKKIGLNGTGNNDKKIQK